MHARGQKNAVSGSSAVKSVIKKMKWGKAPIHLLCIHVNKYTLICIQTRSLFAVRRVYCCRCVLNIVMLILVLHKDAQRESYEFFAHRWSQWETNIKTLISHNFLSLIIALVPFFALLVHQWTWIFNSFYWCYTMMCSINTFLETLGVFFASADSCIIKKTWVAAMLCDIWKHGVDKQILEGAVASIVHTLGGQREQKIKEGWKKIEEKGKVQSEDEKWLIYTQRHTGPAVQQHEHVCLYVCARACVYVCACTCVCA